MQISLRGTWTSRLLRLDFLTAVESNERLAMNEFDVSDLIPFLLLALLFGCLCWKADRPTRLALREQKASEKDWSHKGFEAMSISPQIQELRRNYMPAVRSHRYFPCGRRERIARARCAIGRLSFFRTLKTEPSPRASQQSGDSLTFERG